ncbi:MAG: IS30 family transposase, partial [Xanthomonadaceae bacterium]|nr:IS30 family transposase [Xanthomonadaceae bacterium]MBS3923856.1 IS30 family transposase [Xanthomonadaceae bacterium]
ANVHTLTADNGKEFAEHASIAWALKAGFYFADPYAAWQRGSNENANGLVRQYLPRSADFNAITAQGLRWIEERLNNRPRKTLSYRTPLAVFAEGYINPVANRS